MPAVWTCCLSLRHCVRWCSALLCSAVRRISHLTPPALLPLLLLLSSSLSLFVSCETLSPLPEDPLLLPLVPRRPPISVCTASSYQPHCPNHLSLLKESVCFTVRARLEFDSLFRAAHNNARTRPLKAVPLLFFLFLICRRQELWSTFRETT